MPRFVAWSNKKLDFNNKQIPLSCKVFVCKGNGPIERNVALFYDYLLIELLLNWTTEEDTAYLTSSHCHDDTECEKLCTLLQNRTMKG